MESTANCSFCNKSAILRLKATFVDAFGVIPDNSSTKFVLPVDYNQLQTVEDICKFVFKWLSIDSGKYELQITLDDYAVPSWAPSRMFAQNEEIMLRITSKGESLQLQRHSGRCNDLSQSQTTGNNFRHDSQAENRQRNTCTFKSVNGEPRNSDVKANMKVNGNANVEEHAASTKSRCSEVDSNEVAVANSAKSVEQKLTERLRARNAVFQSLAEIAKCGTESKVSPTSRKRKHTYFQNDEASVADVNDAPSTATIDVVNNGDASGDTSQAKKTTHQVEKSIRTNSSPISTECLGADVCITDHTVLSLDDDQEDAAKILQQREETKLKTALLANFGRKIKAPKTTSKAGAPLSSLSLDALTCQQLPCVNTAVSSPPVFLRQHPSGTILASAATAANSNDVNSLKRGGGKGLVHKSVIIQNVSLRSALPRCSQDTASIVEEKEGLECVLVNLHHGNNAVYTKARYPTAYASIKHPILQPNDIISFRTLELSAFAIPQISAWKVQNSVYADMSKPPPQQRRTSASGCSTSSSALAALQLQQSWQQAFHLQQQLNSSQFMPLSSQRVVAVTTPPASIGQLTQAGMRLNVSPQMLFSPPHASAAATLQLLGHPTASLPFGFLPHFGLHGPPPGLAMLTQLQQHASLGALRNDGSVRFRPRIASDSEISSAANNDMLSSSSRRSERPKEPFLETARSVNCSNTTTCSRSSKTNDATLSDDKLPSKDNSKRPLTDARFRSESFNATQPCQQDGTTDQSAYHHLQQRVTSATTVSSGHQQRSYGNANGYRNLPETKSVASHGRLEAAIASASRMQNLQQSNGNSKASSFSQGGHSRSAGSTQVPPRVDSSFRGRVHQQSSFRGNNVGLRFAKRGFGGSYLKYSTDRRAPFLPLRGGAASTRGRMDARTSSRSQQRDNTNNSNSVSDRQYACSPTSGRSHSRSPAQSLRQLRATSKSGTSSLRCDHTSGPPAQPRPRPHYAASDYNTNLASLRSKTSKRSAASSSSNRTSPVRLSNRMSSQSSKKQGDDFTNNDDTSSQSVGLKRKLEKEEKTSRCVKKVRQEAGQSATPTSGTSRVTAADKSESEMLASNRLVRYTPDSSTAEDDTDDDVTSVHSKTTVKDSVAADGQSDERVGVADVESVSDYSLASSDLEDVTSDISESDEDSADLALPNRATYWTECAPATLHFKREQTMLLALPVDRSRDNCALMLLPPSINVQQRIVRHLLVASARLQGVQAEFETVLERRKRSLLPRPSHDPPPLAELLQKFACHSCCRKSNDDDGSDDADDSDSHSDDDDDSQSSGTAANSKGGGRWTFAQQEIARKIGHPDRLHLEMWFNEKQQANDGPLCRCSWRSRKIGIRHSYYPGEKVIPLCDPVSNNYGKLYHYRIVISPEINFTSKPNTVIRHDNRDYFFEGFSVFCHQKIPDCLPSCRVMRYNIEYSICYIEEEAPENFTVKDLDLFWEYIFVQLLEFLDLNLTPTGAEETTTCPLFHVLPRFARNVEEGGKQLLSSSQILTYLLRNSGSLVPNNKPANLMALSDNAWQSFVEPFKGQLVTNPSKRPSTVRVDQLDRTASLNPRDGSTANFAAGRTSDGFPVVVHFGLKPAMLTYAGNADYQKAYKQLVKFRHLLANKPKVTTEERTKLAQKEAFLQHLRAKASLKRDVTIELSSKGFFRTGLYTDVTQHASMLPVLFSQLRLHWALATLEERLQYKFKSRSLLELALTHPSYRTNYGTNPDHTRNTLTNCGMRQPVYGDGRVHQNYTRKRGINTLIDIMARMGTRKARRSRIMNNERLEYLGDAVVEFLSTIHLFHMFPELQEGGLATYRSALVQNRQLAALARRLGLDEFMLYAHGPDLCHESDLRHAMANCFEAVMAALFLDAGLDVADRVYAEALFPKAEEPMLHTAWNDLPRDPLQEEEPNGDRHWIPSVRILKKLTKFEDATGIHFDHIRILARAFTRRNVGYNFLTHGHNQRMEFLGDTVLQLVTSVYLYKHFPDHHEGHLSLLRSCLVNNKTQSVICDDLGLVEFLVNPPALGRTPAPQELRIKDKADLVESLIGAIFLDCGLDLCKIFCRICFFPRLKYFIMTQKWNDAKSQLQQCCLTLRSPSGGEPDIPTYKVIQARGPTNTRIYTVAVYFRGKRLSSGRGHSVQQAEMCAAELAIKQCGCLFPHLEKQRTIIERRFRQMPEKFYLGRKHTRTVNQHQEFNQ